MKLPKLLFISLIAILISTNNVFTQNNGIIKGKVVSKINEQPLKSVYIRIAGTNLGAISNQDGEYIIKNLESGLYTLQFSIIGYETYTATDVSVNNARPTILNVEMVEKVIQTQDIEVTSNYFNKRIDASSSTETLNAQDIRRAPGVQEDVIRATQLLPGVGVSSAGRNDLVVRGGAPFENLFIVDNIEVPNINHFGTQGSTGGPLSLINIDFVKEVQFSSGAFPAYYGDKVSSITNITLRNGNDEHLSGQANISATGFGLYVEGPVTNKGSYWVSARRSYLDFIFKAAGFAFIPQYWDFQSKVNYNIDSKNSISFLTIGALDNVALNNSNAEDLYNNSRVAIPNLKQYFSAITWKHFYETGYSNLTLGETLSLFDTFQNDSLGVEVFKNISKEAETALKNDYYFQLNKNTNLSFGTQLKYASSLAYNVIIPGNLRTDFENNQLPLQVDTNFTALKWGTYISLTHTNENISYTLGGRADYLSFLKNKFYFSPRASINWQITVRSTIGLSAGTFYQSPSYIWMIGDPSNSNLTAIKANQIVFSFSHTPRSDTKVQVEIYQKWYNDYPARLFRPYAVLAPSGFDDLTNDIPFGLEKLSSIGVGYSRGIEFFIQKKYSEIPLYGLLSLTISDTKFKSLEGDYIEGAYNTPVILNVSAGYRISNLWELSGKFRLASGLPTTPFLGNGQRDYTKYNQGERLPLYHALDLRIDKRWVFPSLSLITYLDVQNVYGRKNVAAVRWDYQTKQPEYQKSFGVLPSIGINFEF
jgi:hypothetical protein